MYQASRAYTVKLVSDFAFPSRDVTKKLSLAGNNLIIPGQGEWLVCRLHTAILDRPPSSAATMEVQGPDTQ